MPSLTLQLYQPRKHFPLVYRWWRARRGIAVDMEFLGRQGGVVYDGDLAIAAAWLYLSDSKVAQIGWTVTNPEAGLKVRAEAVSLLLDELTRMAKELGFTRVITFSSSKGLTRTFESKGFTKLEVHDVLVRAL